MLKNCEYCRSNRLVEKFVIKGYKIIKCLNCNILQTANTFLRIKNINLIKYNNRYLNNYDNIRSQILVKDFIRKLRIIEKSQKGGRLLDIGCSTGLFLKNVKQQSKNIWDLYGLDVNKKSIERARIAINAKYHLGRLRTGIYNKNYFDCITCLDVLEHDFKLPSTLKVIHKILKTDGILLIQVPNYNSLMRLLTGEKWDWWCVPDHLYHFSTSTAIKVLRDNYFMPIKIISWEDRRDFIENIRGKIMQIFPKVLYLNKILARVMYLPLLILWALNRLIGKFIYSGGLTVILAQKI